ncbi:MAG TPA: aconitase family protein, partial [Chlamydiales bacterium]|nr:aconitase family protein [Chlamydiales bacterium]
MLFDLEMMKTAYSQMKKSYATVRAVYKRPLTLTEKILYTHLATPLTNPLKRGIDYGEFKPDRVAMQDATAQMALLQFILAGMQKTAVPTTVHCDHLILAETGAKHDLERSKEESHEVYDFLGSVSNKFGIGFWRPGAGIIHQV